MEPLPDATAQAELVRTGQASPRELVQEAVERAQRLDPQLGALVRERFDEALREAAGDLPDGPFRGVPFLLKDLGCHVAGEAVHYGTSVLRDAGLTWPTTSHLARRFRSAGLISLGRTNVPELGTTITTEPSANGPTRNPWDPSRSAGGSSGGSAAAVAAGIVAAAHANDGGGSIRIPASSCGLVGLKPSRARVSQGPEVGESWAGATIDGVVTRSVRDTAALLDAISGPEPGDPYSAPPLPRPLLAEVGAPVERLRVGLVPSAPPGFWLSDPECAAAVERTGRLLEELGCAVEVAHPEAVFEPRVAPTFLQTVVADAALTLRAFESRLGRPIEDEELEPRNAAYRAMGAQLSAVDYLAARQWLGAWSRRVAAWWAPQEQGGAGFDLLVSPVLTTRPPELGWYTAEGPEREGGRIGSMLAFPGQFNITGQPAVSLPLHETPEGLPVGVQLVARAGREDVLVRVASALEQAAPWAGRRPRVSA